jgi:hypothetical protein
VAKDGESSPRATSRRKSRSSAAASDSTGGSQASSHSEALPIEQPPPFEGGDERQRPTTPEDLEYEPVAPELIEWTPERAAAMVRAGGFLLHNADSASREPGGEEIWRATETDVAAIAPPLARILNRYAPARRLAGVSDEAELAFALSGYTRRNLATRGRVMRAKREREEELHSPEWPHGHEG